MTKKPILGTRVPRRLAYVFRFFATTAAALTSFGAVHGSEPVSLRNRPQARVVTLRLPAPRGKILGTNGEVLAQNRVAYQLQLRFPWRVGADAPSQLPELRNFVNEQLMAAVLALGQSIPFSQNQLEDHFLNRHWLPYAFPVILEAAEKDRLEKTLALQNHEPGWLLVPQYRRHYPKGSLAAHLIGYVGKKGALPRGPLVTQRPGRDAELDPLWIETEGREGLEKVFDDHLRGQDGLLEIVIDEKGREESRRIIRATTPGLNIQTSVHAAWQKQAEALLAQRKRQRSAFVMLDLKTGNVPVLASYPSFKPADFEQGLSEAEFNALANNPNKPLMPRAWQGFYPPGSIFKVVTALAALDRNVFALPSWPNDSQVLQQVVHERTQLDCGPSVRVGKRSFRNWHSQSEGPLDIYQALMRSCNTWFFPVGIHLGAEKILRMAQRLGVGENTGFEMLGEKSPGLPFAEKYSNSDAANFSIGQGELLMSPLQAARMMAALAQGGRSRDFRVVQGIYPDGTQLPVQRPLPFDSPDVLDPELINVVKGGLYLVVNAPGGTAPAAAHPHMWVNGKTGTAEWGPANKSATVAWFAGFVPYHNPRYAFALMLEGNTGQSQSGGKVAAPLVGQFLRKVFPGGIPEESAAQPRFIQPRLWNHQPELDEGLLNQFGP